ncbi:dihydroorotate dehydrogenase [bacterium]|nr:dihydroorotate dehydrogenase [bacterium]
MLSTKVGTLEFRNPILGASGTFGYGLEFAELMDLESIGGFVTKGLSMRPRLGNQPPRIHETSYGMLNAIGLHNIGAKAFVEEKLPKLRTIDTHVIVNVYGESPQDFIDVAQYLSEHEGISALEINVSCPNVKNGLDIGTDPAQAEQLIGKIRQVTHLPMWAKLTPNVTHIKDVAKAVINGGADALSMINSVKAMAIDWRKNTPHLSNVFGGLSGPAIKPIALAKVLEVTQEFDIPVVGMGGIKSAEDVADFLAVGASAVQVGTHNFADTGATEHIAKQLQTLLEKEDLSVSQLKGRFLRREKA